MKDTGSPWVAADYRPSGVVSAVIPTLNEAKNIRWVLERIPDCVDELIIVDGRSTDDTVAVAHALHDEVVVHVVQLVAQRDQGVGRGNREP